MLRKEDINLGTVMIGIDGAAAKSGVVIRHGSMGAELHTEVLKCRGKGLTRAVSQAGLLQNLMEQYDPLCAVIEGYGLGNKFSLATLVEAGTLLRLELWHRGVPWVEVAPKSLKLFATGRGGSKKKPVTKAQMANAAKEQYEFKNKSHDIVDAFWLLRVGMDFWGIAPAENPHQRQVISRLQIKKS